MQPTPVVSAINFTIAKDAKITINPITANITVFLAASTPFGSPPEVINFIPPKIIKITETAPAKTIAQLIKLAITRGRQSNVATPWFEQPLQFIVKAYQEKNINSRDGEDCLRLRVAEDCLG